MPVAGISSCALRISPQTEHFSPAVRPVSVSVEAFPGIISSVYFYVDRKREIWLLLLFVSIAVCDLGYFLMSVAQNLEFALFANRISYLGNVFLPFFLLMMIMNLSGMKYPELLPWILV